MECNLALLHEAIAAAWPDRECIVWKDRRLTYRDVTDRSRRLANLLRSRGLGAVTDRAGLSGWESGQDHVGLYLYNGNEYLEGMLGAFKARTVPFNVNYRYVKEELLYLFSDARARAVIYHASLAPTLAQILPQLGGVELLLQVNDDPGQPLLPGAMDYEAALAASSPQRPDAEWSPDDLYMLYTGGTTGMPKGVLWRQTDVYFAALGGSLPGIGEHQSMDAVLSMAHRGTRTLPSAPFMHGAAHWAAFNTMNNGGTVILQSDCKGLDPDDIWSTVEREKAEALLIVGDAFARPLLDQLASKKYDLSSLALLVSGGAVLNVGLKEALLDRLPGMMILDNIGSSETGSQAVNISARGGGVSTGSFMPQPGNCVLSADLSRVLDPGSDEIGWFAKAGRVPLGYLGDQAKTERTFPVIDGVRYAVPGDRARMLADGMIEVLGRDSVTINSGGEKIFAEEVEQALKRHDDVYDAVVVGRASERWGQEVVAIVRLRQGARCGVDQLLEEAARHLARYKLPKAVIFRDEIVRSPSGKADYRWAKAQAEQG
ncbi:MAG: acyl-CoA synthetase [Deltaproteobacteria bacterium]|nr:acyl-CoA synthetase [Deltaproteobacteria bacterium]